MSDLNSRDSNFSLFAGMNLGGSDKAQPESTPKSKDKVETKLSEERRHNSFTEVTPSATSCESGSGHSSFSFIRQSEPVKQTMGADLDVGGIKCQVSSDKTSLLDLFQTLDESESIHEDNENKLLSYSDQLAEILPMATPADDTLTQLPPECEPEISEPEILFMEANLANKECIREDTNNFLCDSEDTNKDLVVNTDIKELPDAKYKLILDPEDHLTLFCSQHSFKLTELRNEKVELKKNLCLVYEDVKNKIVSLEENLTNLRIKFDEVLSNDDYDLAAEVNEKIEQLTIEKYELQSERPGLLNDKAKEYLSDAATFREKEVNFHECALSKYNELEKQQREILKQYTLESTKEINLKKEDLKFEQGEINRCLEHLYLDKEHVNEDRRELDQKIDTKLDIFQNKKKELMVKHDSLEQGIEMLERKLQSLKSEKKGVEGAIISEEDKMKEARKEFESLETRLKDKSEAIQSKEDMLKDKLEQVELQEKDLEDSCFQSKTKEETLLKNISYLSTNKKKSESLVEESQEPLNKTIMEIFLTKVSEEKSNSLKKLRTLEKGKATELQDLELMIFNKEQNIMMRKTRLDEIENQVPEFEKAKKLAVTEHNFKEAKRLNEIVKQLSNEVETSKKEVLDMENTLKDEREKVAVLKNEFETLKKDALTATEIHDNEIFVRIVHKIMDLVKGKERISENSLLEVLRQSELDLLKTEFNFLRIPSESVVSKMSDIEQQNLTFVKEFLKHEKEMEDASAGDASADDLKTVSSSV